MAIEKIKNNVYWIGVKDPALRVFDIVMHTQEGTTYNSYLIDDDKICIIDAVKNGFYNQFKENIKEAIGDRKVDYIVVQHTELDHSGSLIKLLNDYPEAKVVASKAAINYLKNILNRSFKSIEAKEDLCLGNTTLKFISAPNLHWPDTMFTYIEKENILFTCDFTGCHYATEEKITDDVSGDYYEQMRYYFNVIMGPFKKFVNQGLNKIEGLDIEIIAPSHGPIHMKDCKKYLELYREWAKIDQQKEKKIEIFYITAYGNTEKIAEHIKNKIINKGINCDVHEITSMDINEAVELIEKSSGFMIGSPTINQDAVKPSWDLLTLVNPIINRGKVAAAFGSYGWSGEGVPMLTERLKSLKLKVVDPGFKFAFVPSENDFQAADEFVNKFLELI